MNVSLNVGDFHVIVNTVLVRVAGVGVQSVQRGDPGAAGGRVRPDEAAGRHGRHEGERLQTDVQPQRGADVTVKASP